jgi:Fe2+ or Zn2+ uptake regulation protein
MPYDIIIVILIIIIFVIVRRKSKQHEAIIKVLRGTTSHPSAEWIYKQVKKEIPGIRLATVYRNLKALEKVGEVLELHAFSNTARFDGNSNTHYHFYCERCGKILDLNEPIDPTIETRIARKTGLKVTRHHLELGGLRLDCQKHELQTDNQVER